jgi:flagellar hook assembly protein FlgD
VESRLRVEGALCHPNPVTERSGFFYQLTAPADEVRVEIYTITGRRIRVIESLSARVGYNENAEVWDGRDQDGDALARGAYLFRVIARRAGEKAESVGTIVIGRESE